MQGEVQVAPWASLMLLAVAAGCVSAWTVAVRRVRAGRPVLRRRRRRPVPWGRGGAILAGFSLASSWLGVAFDAAPLLEPDAEPAAAIEIGLLDAIGYTVFLSGLAGVAVAGLCTGGARLPDFGLPYALPARQSTRRQVVRDTVAGIGAWLVMLLPVYVVQGVVVGVFGQPSGHPSIEQLFRNPSPDAIAAIVLMAIVAAPLFEEFAFRVLLQGWLERVAGSRRAWWPILVSSAMFAAAHTGQGYAPVPLFVLALGLGYLYRQTHRFWPCVVAHAAFNSLSLLLALGLRPAN